MSPYEPQDLFEDPILYDLSDLVKGGSDGDANVPIKFLFDRTEWLRRRMGIMEPKTITGAYLYDEADTGKAFRFNITNNSTFTLPDVSKLVPGTPIRINTRIPVIKALTVQCQGGQVIQDGSSDLSVMYMHDAERLILVAASSDNGEVPDHWQILDADGNFKTAGISFGVRKVPRNAIINDGCDGKVLYNRADMPRLWQSVSLMGNGVVSDVTWLSNPLGLPVYRGCFSTGNGNTTFRPPDERAMHDRYLDLGRGIDNSRIYPYAGGYSPDDNKSHSHTFYEAGDNGIDAVNKWRIPESNADFRNGVVIDAAMNTSGGPENTVKTIAKIPITLY